MPSPFPGMDPYLETPPIWRDLHKNLATTIQHLLNPRLRPRYVAVIEPTVTYEQVTIMRPHTLMPDIAVLESSSRTMLESATLIVPAPLVLATTLEYEVDQLTVEIRGVEEGELVTSIEVLSPTNKRRGHQAYAEYIRKRQALLHSDAHLLEIDFLRAGERWPFEADLPLAPYFVFLSRAEDRSQVEIWPIRLQQELPVVPVPLRDEDPDVPLDLGVALREIYDAAAYDIRVNYRTPPPKPKLSPEDAAWVDQLLRQANLR